MMVLPAVDILDGKVVQLVGGKSQARSRSCFRTR